MDESVGNSFSKSNDPCGSSRLDKFAINGDEPREGGISDVWLKNTLVASAGNSKSSNKRKKTGSLNQSHKNAKFATENENGSVDVGKECLEWVISPWNIKTFISKYWEKQPLYIRREDKSFYKHVFSCKAFDELLRNSDKPMIFGKVNT